jgi:inhibitor of KinA sporulation pathway (predicted exonuclease)
MPHWLIIDLEATTDEGGWPVTEMEVIEIGASLVNRQGRELDHFQRFVRPLRRPLLTPFCRQLTHITQANIDGAAPFTEVWPLFERWLGQHQARLEGWASWGDYDRVQLELEWQRHGLASVMATTPHVPGPATSSAGRCAQHRAPAATDFAGLGSFPGLGHTG